MREPDEARERVHARPLGRPLVDPRLAHLLDLGLMRRRGTADHLMTAEARLQRRDPGLARDRNGAMTIQTGDVVLPGMNVVTEEDRLAGTVEPAGIADDTSRGCRWSLTGLRHRREGHEQRDRDARAHTPGPDPVTPLRHPERSMANVSVCVVERLRGRRNVARATKDAQALSARPSLRACEQLMLQSDDGHERV